MHHSWKSLGQHDHPDVSSSCVGVQTPTQFQKRTEFLCKLNCLFDDADRDDDPIDLSLGWQRAFRDVAVQDLAVHENDRIEYLVLCRYGDVSVPGQMRLEHTHLVGFQLTGMPLVVKQNEPLRQADISLLGTLGQVLHPARIRHLIEKSRLARIWGRVIPRRR